MAAVFKRGKFYWVRYTLDGKQHRESLCTCSEKVAKMKLRQYEVALAVVAQAPGLVPEREAEVFGRADDGVSEYVVRDRQVPARRFGNRDVGQIGPYDTSAAFVQHQHSGLLPQLLRNPT